jgi:hypothetical protein
MTLPAIVRHVMFVSLVLTHVITSTTDAVRAEGAARPTWGHARIVERAGHSIFEVDGKPFFLYGAAFFYERLPRDRWEPSMAQLHGMGINTLDLYVPWNWHELADGDFDFTGRTSPRRDFDEVLRLAKQFDFKIVLRPGPVVRNEWRNGGYPAWLLSRPEYGMPLHDLLEGRYPPTATLQNQHSDDAAAEWMRNATHVKYARRWLERVLAETAPYADRILAVALDDDQGAYIDNQTYPAPHFKAYLEWLRGVVHGVTGPDELTFINTYQMKVPASSPVWAMGNWYQSDTYATGEHDESQLAFTFAQLATRPDQPLFASEFQAGWLQGAGEANPRGADPSNTELAMATMLGAGVRGIVNFPAQDTLNPTGWEAPFANFAYAWDAAMRLDGEYAARFEPTAGIGGLVRAYGAQLASAFPRFDADIVYAGGLVPEAAAGGTTFSEIASATIAAQSACREAGYACALIDPSLPDAGQLQPQAVLLVPDYEDALRKTLGAAFSKRLRALEARGVRIRRVRNASDVRLALAPRLPVVQNVADAVFAESTSPDLAGFLSVTNYSAQDRTYAHAFVTTTAGKRIALAPFVVRAHHAVISPLYAHDNESARVLPFSVPNATRPTPSVAATPLALRPDFALPSEPLHTPETPATSPFVRVTDVFREGSPSVVYDDGSTQLIVSPNAGARAFYFADGSGRNWFTTVGGMRDDVAIEPPLSTTDRIAKYTHDFPAGTFNRTYAVSGVDERSATFAYTAPDVLPNGATFTRNVALARDGTPGFDLDESVDFAKPFDIAQRAVSVSSFALDSTTPRTLYATSASTITSGTTYDVSGNGFALANADGAVVVAWHAGDVEAATLVERSDSIVARLTYAPGVRAHVVYRIVPAAAASQALTRITSEAQLPQVSPNPTRTP